jgi:uncharacterized protein YecT (DUF1311 family)
MGKRDRTGEILEIKERSPHRFGFVSYHLETLFSQWKKIGANQDCNADFFVIRAVTLLEVFTRRRVCALVNHDDRFAVRAGTLMKDYKIEYEILRNIHGRTITLGDMVAYSVPINSFGQLISHFEILLEKGLRKPLAEAVDRWRVEIEKKPSEPIIPDYDQMAKTLTRLFEIRHILCHELPEKPVYARSEVEDLLSEAMRFVKAFEWVLNFELYGNTPLTQTEINVSARNELIEKEKELECFLAAIPAKIELSDGELDALSESQAKWLAFRKAHCEFVTHLNKGGTIRGLLWSAKARMMTEERLTELKRWFEHRSKG